MFMQIVDHPEGNKAVYAGKQSVGHFDSKLLNATLNHDQVVVK